MNISWSTLTGGEFEMLVFGRSHHEFNDRVPPWQGFEAACQEVVARHSHRHLDALNWNCHRPSSVCGWQLYWYVFKWLPKRDRLSLRLFCSIGTALDYWHGVDGFFWYQDNRARRNRTGGIERIATLDLATFDKPEFKADFLVTADLFRYRQVKPLGQRIANQLLGRVTPPGWRAPLPPARQVLRV